MTRAEWAAAWRGARVAWRVAGVGSPGGLASLVFEIAGRPLGYRFSAGHGRKVPLLLEPPPRWGPGPVERHAEGLDVDEDTGARLGRESAAKIARLYAELVEERRRRGRPVLTPSGRLFARLAREYARGPA